MTSIEWLDEQIQEYVIAVDHVANTMLIQISFEEYIDLKRQAKEMHKAEIIDAVLFGMQKGLNINKVPEIDSDWVNNYYQETFVSKGSDLKQFSLYEHKDTITSADTQVSKTFLESVPQQETLYTEEQVREAIKMAQTRKYNSHFYNADEIIQSLKK